MSIKAETYLNSWKYNMKFFFHEVIKTGIKTLKKKGMHDTSVHSIAIGHFGVAPSLCFKNKGSLTL